MPLQRNGSRKITASSRNHRSYRQLPDTLMAPDIVTSNQLPRVDALLPAEPNNVLSPNKTEDVAKQAQKLTNCGSCDSLNHTYDKHSKVVISVTVLGSTGPVRTMVKLGMSVEDTISHVIEKYNQEGRSPMLKDDASSPFKLHFSFHPSKRVPALCFTLHINRDLGARSFYLRKDKNDANITEAQKSVESLTSEHVKEQSANISASSLLFSPADSVSEKLKKITGFHKLRKIFGCLHCE